jgi:hypothetical protein
MLTGITHECPQLVYRALVRHDGCGVECVRSWRRPYLIVFGSNSTYDSALPSFSNCIPVGKTDHRQNNASLFLD